MPRPRPILALMERSLAWMERRQSRRIGQSETQRRGESGERAAYFYLRRRGYVIVARRWTNVHVDGEVDLIGWDGETLCLIEVKSRSSRTPFAAEYAVDRNKQETLRRMADAYIRQLPWHNDEPPALHPRFDVVSVYLQQDGKCDIRLLQDCFR
jgi:putative endonuclease